VSFKQFMGQYTLTSFFGQVLKSRDVVDLLERFELDVIYDFDRVQEGTPDAYHVSAHELGLEMKFDEKQILETLWCYVKPRGKFAAIERECIGVFIPKTHAEAKGLAIKSGNPYQSDDSGESTYVRLDGPTMWVHYEFVRGELSLVTIMRPWE
jgi:hypothetical protein